MTDELPMALWTCVRAPYSMALQTAIFRFQILTKSEKSTSHFQTKPEISLRFR